MRAEPASFPWRDSVLRVCWEQQAFFSVRVLSHLSACHHSMEDSMDMDMSPLRPQNYLFGKCPVENVGARPSRAWWGGCGAEWY